MANESKFVKAYCERTGQFFALEIKKFMFSWKVVNVTHLTSTEAKLTATEVEQKQFETNSNLLPCFKCGSRKVGGCSCAKRVTNCSRGMKYNFMCTYCDSLKIDYSLPSAADVGARAGEKVVLSQGQEVKIRFSDDRPLTEIIVGVGWDPATGANNMDVDSSVIVLSPDGCGRDLVYFGAKEHASGCVIHHGDNLTGEGSGQGDDENITVRLNKVPQNRDRLVFVLNIYDCVDRGQTLGKVKNLYIRLYDPVSKKALIEYRVTGNMQNDTALVIGMAFRKAGGWSFKAIGRSLRCDDVQDLTEVCTRYLD